MTAVDTVMNSALTVDSTTVDCFLEPMKLLLYTTILLTLKLTSCLYSLLPNPNQHKQPVECHLGHWPETQVHSDLFGGDIRRHV